MSPREPVPPRGHALPRGQVLLALLAGVVVLAGCSDPSPAPGATPGGSVTGAPSATGSAGPTAPSGAPTSATPGRSSTSAPPSSAGSVEPSRTVETAAPKQLDETARSAGAEVSLTSVRATTITSSSPVDRSGPGVLVRLRVRNTTSRTLDTSFVQVAAANAAGAPGTLLSGRPTDQLGASVRSGASAEGTYAFVLDDATSGPVTVRVYVTSGQPVLQFRGRVS